MNKKLVKQYQKEQQFKKNLEKAWKERKLEEFIKKQLKKNEEKVIDLFWYFWDFFKPEDIKEEKFLDELDLDKMKDFIYSCCQAIDRGDIK